ncbi:MAG: glycosyltransferase [Eubacterium sp.]|nr:glycosyltransferase [Eubacterium sp.]
MKKRVLFVINTMGQGGAETALLALLKKIDYSRFRVSLFVLLGQGELLSRVPSEVHVLNRHYDSCDVQSAKGRVRLAGKVLSLGLSQGAFVRDAAYLGKNFLAMRQDGRVQADKLLWRVIADGAPVTKDEYDLAVAFLEGAASYYVADRVHAARKVCFVHVDTKAAGYTRELDGDCYSRMDRIFCVSGEVRDSFLSRYPEYGERTAVFHNILDTDYILSMQKKDVRFPDEESFEGFRILTCARLVRQKELEISIEAMRILRERGTAVRWYVYGEGEERSFLEKKIREYDLTDAFFLPGRTENPYPLYKKADLYVHCSRYEGKSIAIQEAMFSGCAVIASDCSGNREQIESGKDGMLVAFDAAAIADAVEELLRDPDRRRAFGAAAAKRDFSGGSMDQLLVS